VIPDPETVRFWQARAQAYDRLCRRWEIFSLLSTRLVDLLREEVGSRLGAVEQEWPMQPK
jgi:hypothetical protein